MFARYFFIALGIVSIIWIGYVATDIIDKKESLSPGVLFGKEDKQILIINRKKEVNLTLLPFSTNPKNKEILGAILPNIKDEKSIFISSERRHFLIESKYPWTKKKVLELLDKSGLKAESTGMRSFQMSTYQIDFLKNSLYFHEANLTTENVAEWTSFDRKSSATLIDFTSDELLIKEIYFKGSDKIEFHTKNSRNIIGRQVKDQELFSTVLPVEFNNYHFYEKEFAKGTDVLIKGSPFTQWLDKGFVTIDFKGEKVLISDYISGQDPINVMYDHVKQDAENVEHAFFINVQLLSDFPSSPEIGFYMYSLNDFVIISQNQSICEEIVTQNKLGNTLATNPQRLSELYSGLPSMVSERYISTEEKFSRSVYKTKILETRLLVNSTENSTRENIAENTVSMNVDAVIHDFIAFEGKGNSAVMTATGELMYFSNGKLSWIKNLKSKAVGNIQYVEQYQFLIITCKNSIHVIDRKGNYVLGGPIDLNGRHPVQAASQYEWKNKLYIVFPDESGNIIVYDSKRKLHSTINNNLADINAPVDVWVSQKKLFYGIQSNTVFKMFDALGKREFRSFTLPGECKSIIKGNEIILFSNENSKLVYLDQKGIKHELTSTNNGKLIKTALGRKETYLLNNSSGKLTIYSSLGTQLGSIQLDFSDVEFKDVQTINGRTIVSVIDGLENNVYLYELDGEKIIEQSLEGSKKCMLNVNENTLTLTTIVDNYLIQYQLKN